MTLETEAEREPSEPGALESLEQKLELPEGLSDEEAQELRSRIMAEVEDWERMGFVKAELVDSLVHSIRFEEAPSADLLAQYGVEKASGSWNPETRQWTLYGEYFRQEGEARRHIGLHEIMGHGLMESGIFAPEAFGRLRRLAEQTSFDEESPYVQELLNQFHEISTNRSKLETAAVQAQWDNPEEYLSNLQNKIVMEKLAERLSGWFENKRESVPGDSHGEFAKIFTESLGSDEVILEKLAEIAHEREEEEEDIEREILEQQLREEEMKVVQAQNPARELSIKTAEKSGGQLFEPPVAPTQSGLGWIFEPLRDSVRKI